jgi:hypothetical protein
VDPRAATDVLRSVGETWSLLVLALLSAGPYGSSGGELGIPIADEKPTPMCVVVKVHQQIPDHLRHHSPVGCTVIPGRVHPTSVEFNDEQRIDNS